MIKIVPAALPTAIAATLLLAGCGHSGKAGDATSAENVEMPAEEALRNLDAGATPVPDAEATATVDDSAAPPAPSPAATPSAKPAPSPSPSASPIRM